MKKVLLAALAGTSLAAVTFADPAMAQSASQVRPGADSEATDDAKPSGDKEIVVTGTQIRGIAPVGANTSGLSKADIDAAGVTDMNQLLARLPQAGGDFFLGLPEPGGTNVPSGTTRAPLNRPNLRSIPGFAQSSGQLTLVLLDGHRMVPSGLEQTSVDVSVIPTGILERLEVVLDGASAVYGSDAVGGVMNFITRKRSDGITISARGGFADNYWMSEATASAGKKWDNGGISFVYEFAKNSSILNRDRASQLAINWYNPLSATTGLAVVGGTPAIDDIPCDLPNVRTTASGTMHATSAGATPGVAAGYQFCDATAYESFTPKLERHSGFVVFSQDISDRLRLDVTGLFTSRVSEANTGPYAATITVSPTLASGATNPVYKPSFGTGTQTVNFNFGPALGNQTGISRTSFTVGQISPELTYDLGKWQLRSSFTYGRSVTSVLQRRLDSTYVQSQVNLGLFDPYWVANPSNGAYLGAVGRDFLVEGYYTMYDARAVADGPLFSLPGGEVKLSFGAEWNKTNYKKRTTNTTFVLQNFIYASQTSKSLFGEVVVPIIGAGNSGVFHSLTVSASGRYDDYGAYGKPFDPRLALTFEPVDWITLRANWSKSFRAPNPSDLSGIGYAATTIRCFGTSALPCGGQIAATIFTGSSDPIVDPSTTRNNVFLLLGGTKDNLKPEKSTNWSIGLDLKPPMIPGLNISGTYWYINFKDQINFASIPSQALFDARPELFIKGAALAPYLANLTNVSPDAATILSQASPYDIVYVFDGRTQNGGSSSIVKGIDASLRYQRPTNFGSISLALNGAWTLSSLTQALPGGAFADNQLTGVSKFRGTATLGAQVSDFRVQATLRHQAGFDATMTNRLPTQTKIGSFNVLDMSFNWNVGGSSTLTKDLSFTLSVNNVFDTDPPINMATNAGGNYTINGNTLGRTFIFGISKGF